MTTNNLSSLPIYQPQDLNGKPLGKAFSTEAVAWEVADVVGAPQVTDLLWTACIFDVAVEAAAKREADFEAWWESLPE